MSGSRPQQLADHDVDLPPGQVGAQAEVGSGGTESDVGVGVAAHVEAVGVLEDRLVPVGRVVEEQHLVARRAAPRPTARCPRSRSGASRSPGEAHRTISSTPVAATAAGSACHSARWSGCSVRASRPWVMALRVVSLPAVSSRMKKEASSPGVRASPSMLVVISAVVRSSVGLVDPVGAELVHQVGELLAGVDEGQHRVGPLGDVLGVAVAQDDVGAAEDGGVLGGGHAHHVADDLERERGGDLGDEVALARGRRPGR